MNFSPRSPAGSPWAMPEHGIDYNGYIPSPSSATMAEHDAAAQYGNTSVDISQSRQRRGSSPGKRALNWFTRSRSNSPASNGPPSPSSFVVRSVVKQPGGVSEQQQQALDAMYAAQHQQQHQQQAYPYQQIKSQPLVSAPSLGVPPGGPGGGVGYGTAKSSNDGRPELDPHSAPVERGRSRSKSPSRPPSPGAINAGAFRGGRVSPGPMSYRQLAEESERAKQQLQERPHLQRFSNPHPAAQDNSAMGPQGPRASPFGPGNASPHASSPLAGSVLAPTTSTEISAQTHQNGSNAPFSMAVQIPFGAGPPPVIPLNGMPSPVKIPFSPSRNAASPFGSASPAGSPGFMGRGHEQQQGADGSPGTSPGMASKWFKGLFGKSPRQEERDDGIYQEGEWMRQGTSPGAARGQRSMEQQNSNAWSDGSPLAGTRGYDEIEREAMERKKHSMMLAAQIEDEHRIQLMMGKGNGLAPDRSDNHANAQQKAWSPAQVIGNSDSQDFPQSKSPPGRKPPPKFSERDLQGMSEKEREEIAAHIDPDDRLSKLEGRLTPAQQIIAETRSKMLAREEAQKKATASGNTTQVQRGFDAANRPPMLPAKTSQRSQTDKGKAKENGTDDDAPVRRGSKRQSPVKETKADRLSSAPLEPSNKATPANDGLKAGQGPLPMDTPLPQALQEMMVRFYRFERYAVPLMRSLEARLIDVERDNQMALHGDTMSANSARDREMDRWVGQMTSLMHHEVGQLQAATREIRGSRELVAEIAKRQALVDPIGSGESVANAINAQEDSAKAILSNPTRQDTRQSEAEMESQGNQHEERRRSNFSSATFNSTVKQPAANDVSARAQTNASNGSASAANPSPNGRPRYTHALGRPLHDGKISPLVSPSRQVEESPLESVPSPSPSDDSSASRRTMSVDERLKALLNEKMLSPSVTAQQATKKYRNGGSLSGHREESSAEGSDDLSFEQIALPTAAAARIGDDYQLVTARGPDEASARSASQDSTEKSTSNLLGTSELQRAKSQAHTKHASTFSSRTEVTVTPATVARGTPFPTSPKMPLSPSGVSSSLKLASAVSTPTKQRSISPASMAVQSNSPIKTATHASQGLRARAQSYLQNAEVTGSPDASMTMGKESERSSSSPNASAIGKRFHSTSESTGSTRSPLTSHDVNDTSLHHSADDAFVRPPYSKSSVRPQTGESKSQATIRGNTGLTVSSSVSNMDTVKRSSFRNDLTTKSAASTPTRPSIKDRVAFFDAQK